MQQKLGEGAAATLVTLAPFLAGLEPPEGVDIPRYLARCAAAAPTIVNTPDYARQVVDLAFRRAIMRVAHAALEAAAAPAIGGPTAVIAAQAIDGFNEIVAATTARARLPLAECAGELLDYAEKIRAGAIKSQAVRPGFAISTRRPAAMRRGPCGSSRRGPASARRSLKSPRR